MKRYIYLILASIFLLVGCKSRNQREPVDIVDLHIDEYRHCVRVNGNIYVKSPYLLGYEDDGKYDGKIKTNLGKGAELSKDDQSNFGLGNKYKHLDNGDSFIKYLAVEEEGHWWVYHTFALDYFSSPKYSAQFTAFVDREEDGNLILVIQYIPKDFKWIFNGYNLKEKSTIKLPLKEFQGHYLMGNEIEDYDEVKKALISKEIDIYFSGYFDVDILQRLYAIYLDGVDITGYIYSDY